MILYHGTDSKNLTSILTRGLLPRKFTGNQVYTGQFASNDSFVYLTRWNPVAHAYSIDENSPVIIKVDVDEKDLYPDEDFIERMQFIETGKSEDPTTINVRQYKDLWHKSYLVFGNVAISQVLPTQIVSHVVLDPADFSYHCGLGAQGNRLCSDLRNTVNVIDGQFVAKCLKRLDLLFTKGWEATKKDILRERPSLAWSLPKPSEQIRVRGSKLRVLFRPSIELGLSVYICDEWQDNFPIKFPEVDKRFSKIVQIPISEVRRSS